MTDLVRGSIVLFAERGDYTTKPRPGLIVQHGSTLTDASSVTLCGITSFMLPANAARLAVVPSAQNGLKTISYVMIDKIASVKRFRVRETIGVLDQDLMRDVDHALRRWLDL